METTQITAERTAHEIMDILRNAGANRILTEYNEKKKLSGLSFILTIYGQSVPFTLPARIEPMFLYIQRQRAPMNRAKKKEQDLLQAERVAWRQLLRWIQAQLAMIDTGMVEAGEVFMPYIQVAPGRTFWEHAIESGKLALPLPSED